MTPSQIITQARNRYNATGDNLWSESELLYLILFGMYELTYAGLIIEGTDTSITTVASTQAYNFPTNYLTIKRILYDGTKLAPIDFRQDDAFTLYNATTTDTGTPTYYMIWNEQILLRSVPSDAKTLTIYGIKEPTLPLITDTTLDTHAMWDSALIDYMVKEMTSKDGNTAMYDRLEAKWERTWIPRVKKWIKLRKRSDAYAIVKNEDTLSVSIFGAL